RSALILLDLGKPAIDDLVDHLFESLADILSSAAGYEHIAFAREQPRERRSRFVGDLYKDVRRGQAAVEIISDRCVRHVQPLSDLRHRRKFKNLPQPRTE